MRHKNLLSGCVLGALAVTVSLACSSGDSQGNGPTSSAGTNGTTGGKASGGSATGGSANNSGTGPNGISGTQSQSGSANGGSSQGGSGTSQAGSANGGSSSGAGGTSAGGSGGGSVGGAGGANSGAPTAAQILAKLGTCKAVHDPPFNPDEGSAVKIDVCQLGTALWWKADMDVDCDGIQTPPCNTDNTGQPQTSVQSSDIPGGDVDPTKLPYFVMPLGNPETEWYTAYGVDLGQIGAVIYKNQVIYGVFADQAGGNFIGEASYNMCSLFIGANNCDPNNGGIDPLDVTYVTFGGTTPRVSGADFLDHAKHTTMGEAAAKAWLAQ